MKKYMTNPTDAQLESLLREAKTIAVVGLSPDSTRPSNGIGRYLQRVGYRVIPVNPNANEVLGEKSYPSLRHVTEPVDIVCVFRRPEFMDAFAGGAIAMGAKALWMQLGIANPEAAERVTEAGLLAIQDRCIMIEHMRLVG
jgi:uncharacterized protein